MKRLYIIIMIASGLLMSVACMKETLEPEQRVEGDFVADEATQGRNYFISFNKGVYVKEVARNLSSFYYAEDKLWGCSYSDFSSNMKPYSITGGELVLDGVSQGKISLSGNNLLIGTKRYKKLKGVESSSFFTIVSSYQSGITLDQVSQSMSIPYAVTSRSSSIYPLLDTVICSASWVKNLTRSFSNIFFNVEENNSGRSRSADLILRARWAKDVTIHITQVASTAPEPPEVSRTDLSATQSANCYVVSSAGAYKFKGNVKGNSTTSLDGTPIKAELLWESFGTSVTPSVNSVIASVSYKDGYVEFETPSTLKNGNAVIAVKNSSGTILWSWHIWVCSGYNPASTAQTYKNSAGTMMDRNLGATSATPGDVGALGLLYQWGRKDPFLGGCLISYSYELNQTKANSTCSWPSAVASTSTNGTIAYAVKNPTTFIKSNSNNYDWYYSSSSTTDNTRWQSTKTIYDPCPPGWRVPDGGSSGVWSKAVGSSSSFSHSWISTNKGMNFSSKFGSVSSIWYPAAGCLNDETSSLCVVGTAGVWWSCTSYNYNAYLLYLDSNSVVDPSDSDRRAFGCSVRCVQE